MSVTPIKEDSPHGILSAALADAENIEALFLVVKRKDGLYRDAICGDKEQASFAVQILTRSIQEEL